MRASEKLCFVKLGSVLTACVHRSWLQHLAARILHVKLAC